jgi:HPt (histidine-containing phosphotransfer) domain-containing protein
MVSDSAIQSSESTDHPLSASVASDVVDCDVLTAFESVKSDDDQDIVIELIDLYLNSAPRRIEEIRNATGDDARCVIKRVAHTLKGSSSTLGLRGVANACQQLEDLSSSSGASANMLVGNLESRFAEARKALIAERRRRAG